MFPAPTLRRRMIFTLGLLVLGSLAMGVGAMFAVNGLHQDLGSAVQGYRQLRQLFTAGFFASRARDEMASNPPEIKPAIAALRAAFSSLADNDLSAQAPVQWTDESARQTCRDLLLQAITDTEHGINSPSLNTLFSRLDRTSEQVRQSIVDAQSAADLKRKQTLWGIIALSTILFFSAVAIGVSQYRRVIGPISKIGQSARAFAVGNFDQRIHLSGDREFVALGTDFNQMADQLSALYTDLEKKVQSQSKELLRSERLASVGYLASGVAHEINNPLGIIAGYAERTMKRLAEQPGDLSLDQTQKALTIICEEAFRCKQITDRLLSLARPGTDGRKDISLAALAEGIITTLNGLGSTGGRGLKIEYDLRQDLRCTVHEGEMKQVLLNLLLNALEAVNASTGSVLVKVWRIYDQVQLSIADNGQGMSAETMNLIFQPFFTRKRSERAGTGLGLSIAHAIVSDQGGTILVHSDGVNLGSCFTIELPAAVAGGNSGIY